MATVRIYKVAELLDISSQEVLSLLKKVHGIDVKSASSTIEEVVARQFVERVARERGLALPGGALFADAPGGKARKATKPVEPPKPSAPVLPPPRLIKTIRPAAPPPTEAAEAAPTLEPALAAPEAELVEHPVPAAPTLEPLAVHAAAPEPAAEEAPVEPELEVEPAEPPAAMAGEAEAGTAHGLPSEPLPARIVPSSLRLRVEDPSSPRTTEPLPTARLKVPTPTARKPVAAPTAPSPMPAAPARPGEPPAAPGRAAAAAPGTAIRTPLPPIARPTYAPTRPAGTTLVSTTSPTGARTLVPPPSYRPSGAASIRPGQPGSLTRPPGPPRPQHRPRPAHGGRRDQVVRPAPVPAAPTAPPPITRTVSLAEGMTVKDLADKLDVKVKDVLKRLLDKRLMMTINTTLDTTTATMIAREFGADVLMRTFEEELVEVESEATRPEDRVTRAPVVTVMGHVDHGKTTLLDAIRETRVAEREAGGITQHIGAYAVDVNQRKVVFLDTPGHEAFTMMRARGARVTDVVILVVAADDGVMPQTREAIDHARAANVPIVVAINKIDKPDANPDRVKKELSDLGLVPEDWGGQTVTVNVSAKKKQNLDLLLEMILIVTELSELKANPRRSASGTVLEAELDRGRGPVATVLVQDGTLSVGDTVIAGTIVGKIRALVDDRGRTARAAGPSTPVEVLGLAGLPQPGDTFQVIADAAKARQIAMFRQAQAKERALGARASRLTLESLQQQIAEGGVKELPIIIKADVQGSAEVLADTLQKLSDERVKIRIIHAGVGAINESDALLASASNAIIVGFSVRPDRNAQEVTEREQVDVRLHSVIYNVTDEIKKAMAGLLEPTLKEIRIGSAEVRQLFKVPKFGTVAGCIVTEGRIVRSGDAQARLLRDNVVVFEGRLGSLRRFKDDVSEVKSGLECGIAFERYNDLKVGDVIEVFTVERIAATV